MFIALALTASLMTQASAPKVDACALLTDADVASAIGVAVTERQPGTQESRGLLLTQCYYGTGTPRSVSVAVAGNTRAGGKTFTPREYWRQQFHPPENTKGGEARGERDGESTARPIPGLGDEAFWSGNRIAGALYVLRGRTFLRVSVGGFRDERERIAKSTALARAALKRLS